MCAPRAPRSKDYRLDIMRALVPYVCIVGTCLFRRYRIHDTRASKSHDLDAAGLSR